MGRRLARRLCLMRLCHRPLLRRTGSGTVFSFRRTRRLVGLRLRFGVLPRGSVLFRSMGRGRVVRLWRRPVVFACVGLRWRDIVGVLGWLRSRFIHIRPWSIVCNRRVARRPGSVFLRPFWRLIMLRRARYILLRVPLLVVLRWTRDVVLTTGLLVRLGCGLGVLCCFGNRCMRRSCRRVSPLGFRRI